MEMTEAWDSGDWVLGAIHVPLVLLACYGGGLVLKPFATAHKSQRDSLSILVAVLAVSSIVQPLVDTLPWAILLMSHAPDKPADHLTTFTYCAYRGFYLFDNIILLLLMGERIGTYFSWLVQRSFIGRAAVVYICVVCAIFLSTVYGVFPVFENKLEIDVTAASLVIDALGIFLTLLAGIVLLVAYFHGNHLFHPAPAAARKATKIGLCFWVPGISHQLIAFSIHLVLVLQKRTFPTSSLAMFERFLKYLFVASRPMLLAIGSSLFLKQLSPNVRFVKERKRNTNSCRDDNREGLDVTHKRSTTNEPSREKSCRSRRAWYRKQGRDQKCTTSSRSSTDRRNSCKDQRNERSESGDFSKYGRSNSTWSRPEGTRQGGKAGVMRRHSCPGTRSRVGSRFRHSRIHLPASVDTTLLAMLRRCSASSEEAPALQPPPSTPPAETGQQLSPRPVSFDNVQVEFSSSVVSGSGEGASIGDVTGDSVEGAISACNEADVADVAGVAGVADEAVKTQVAEVVAVQNDGDLEVFDVAFNQSGKPLRRLSRLAAVSAAVMMELPGQVRSPGWKYETKKGESFFFGSSSSHDKQELN